MEGGDLIDVSGWQVSFSGVADDSVAQMSSISANGTPSPQRPMDLRSAILFSGGTVLAFFAGKLVIILVPSVVGLRAFCKNLEEAGRGAVFPLNRAAPLLSGIPRCTVGVRKGVRAHSREPFGRPSGRVAEGGELPLVPCRRVDLKTRLGVSDSRVDAQARYWRIMVGDSRVTSLHPLVRSRT